jgi:hypothetical protein
MPGKFSTWLLTLILLALVGLTVWMFWALQKLEGHEKPRKQSGPGASSVVWKTA